MINVGTEMKVKIKMQTSVMNCAFLFRFSYKIYNVSRALNVKFSNLPN